MSIFFSFTLLFLNTPAWASSQPPVTLTLLHTNDLHSHFQPEKTPLALGGVARIKTQVDRVRKENPNTLLVDGGDWSEGSIYYFPGAGRESLRMLDKIGYDIALVGNHDWLNGPSRILDNAIDVRPKVELLGANFSVEDFDRGSEFRKWIKPYTIREIAGIKVAFMGLATYEFVFNHFMEPVKILEPFTLARQLARQLRKRADLVIAISHHRLSFNQQLLEAIPELDVIIGAHDHQKLIKPTVVPRPNAKDGLLVETGCWGHYLGRMDFKFDPNTRSINLDQYRLIQMDRTVPQDPEVANYVSAIEADLESHGGPIFHDHLGENETELTRSGFENLMGDFTTDAYLSMTQADFAVDVTRFIYGEIHPGPLTTADMINANPAVFNPNTESSWTVKVLPMKGRTIRLILNSLLASRTLQRFDLLNVSGAEIIFSPAFGIQRKKLSLFDQIQTPVTLDNDAVTHRIWIKSKPLDLEATYQVAIGGGILEAFRFLNNLVKDMVPLDAMKETGVESWKVMARHFQNNLPFTPSKIVTGNRIRTLQPDLGIQFHDITWEPIDVSVAGALANIKARVRNTGATESRSFGPVIRIQSNQYGTDGTREPVYRDLGDARPIPAIQAGGYLDFEWRVVVPEDNGIFPLTVTLLGLDDEVNHSNDQVTRGFTIEKGKTLRQHSSLSKVLWELP